MALPTDGIYMGAHVLAIGLSWMAYIIVRKVSTSKKLKAIQIKYSTGALLQSVPNLYLSILNAKRKSARITKTAREINVLWLCNTLFDFGKKCIHCRIKFIRKLEKHHVLTQNKDL